MKNIKNIIEQKYPPENPNDLWMKDNVLYKSTHKGWTPLTAGGGSSTNGVTSTTWQELKDKRDAGKLTPGALYRITDYQCTTTQENTKSAGHQFDIVLLALSNNKLAEEGWAMMHDNIYDVLFTGDNVIKKCYLYKVDEDDELIYYNIVDVETKIGQSYVFDLVIDEANKTAETGFAFADLTEENLSYNYFQNSNLSAWKVWYCLDNDKSRFAWASNGGKIQDKYYTYTRDESLDENNYFAWVTTEEPGPAFTQSEKPNIGDAIYDTYFTQFSSILAVENEGTGVIYRLIDEWNNDVPYDFKNIQFYVDGQYFYAIADSEASDDDPTLDGVRVKKLYLLSNYNSKLYRIITNRLSQKPAINIIFLNNSAVYEGDGYTIVRDGRNLV